MRISCGVGGAGVGNCSLLFELSHARFTGGAFGKCVAIIDAKKDDSLLALASND